LFTIPCEAVFNKHPKVTRSALVGVQGKDADFKLPVLCIHPEKGIGSSNRLKKELLELAASYSITAGIKTILFFKKFPVDPRHNAKIFREKLAEQVSKKIK
jgi:acyl-coenzyme A synthetase/AMP-(fatty) acid ligase